MSEAYRRKKDPERIKAALIGASARLAARSGFSRLSLQSIAQAAGVTKGAIFHHFPNKDALVNAALTDVMQQLDSDIDALIQQSGHCYGCFTRAYIQILLSPETKGHFWSLYSPTLLQDEMINDAWYQWLNARLEKHSDTDRHHELCIIRYAADGAWISAPSEPTENMIGREKTRQMLLSMVDDANGK